MSIAPFWKSGRDWTCTILWIAVLVWYGSVVFIDVPMSDDYGFIRQLQFYTDGGESFFDYILRRHNEHLSVAGRLGFLWVERLADIDTRLLRWFSLFILIGCGLFVRWRTVVMHGEVAGEGWDGRQTWVQQVWALIPLTGFVMTASLMQWEVLLLGMGICNTSSVFASIVALYLFARGASSGNYPYLVLAVLCSTLAYMNFATGIITLLVGGVVIITIRGRGRWWWVCGLLALALWQGLQQATATPQGPPRLANGVGVLRCTAEILSIPFKVLRLIHPDGPSAMGWVLLIVLVPWSIVSLLHGRRAVGGRSPGRAFALGLMLFGLLCCIAIAYGRLDEQGRLENASRYYPFAMMTAYGVLLTLFSCPSVMRSRIRSRIAGSYFVLIVLGQAAGSLDELMTATHRQAVAESIIENLKRSDQLSDEELAGAIYMSEHHMHMVRDATGYLRDNHYSLFRDSK